MAAKLLSVVERMRELSLRLCGVKKETYHFVREKVWSDVNNLSSKMMGLADVDLELTDEEFEELCIMLVRSMSKFQAVFFPPMVRFFTQQFASRGFDLEQTLVFLKKTFKENAPDGTRWKFEKPDADGDFIIHDLTRKVDIDVIRVATHQDGTEANTTSDLRVPPVVPPETWDNLPQN